MMNTKYLFLAALAATTVSCSSNDDINPSAGFPTTVLTPKTTVSEGLDMTLATDKAIYAPGETVTFTLSGSASGLKVRYRQGCDVVATEALSGNTWTWTAPSTDGRGYLVDVYADNNGPETIHATIGVDVSSSWALYPRYGFVSDYGSDKTSAVISREAAQLNRYHINGVQFYDWQYKHHRPAPVDDQGNLLATYTDIANRTLQTSVVKGYISALHGRGMKTMFYNLCYGALDDAQQDGVSDRWMMYNNTAHSDVRKLDMADSWKSDIYLTNPGDAAWQQYMAQRIREVYQHFDFDGFHTDQLGDQGAVYDYYGSLLNLKNGFRTFLNTMKADEPQKSLVMNAVANYGSKDILSSGAVDFAYCELWDGEGSFADLHEAIKNNNSYSNGTRRTVLAAYMNYRNAMPTFNTPGVLLTDAAIFALGGSHIELSGDHMLYSEYFPDKDKQMDATLQSAIVNYYDFMTAYEDLLRGEGYETTADVYSGADSVSINQWPPRMGSVAAYARQSGNRLAVQLLNFRQANSLSWRDLNGTQPEPTLLRNLPLRVKAPGAHRVWVATPDYLGGVPQELNFEQQGDYVTINLPVLKYWTMVVIE